MNKADLINKVFQNTNITRNKAEIVVNIVFDSMVEALIRGDRVEVRGFGTFTAKHYDGYNGRNPRTGALIKVKPKRRLVFKVGKILKEAVKSNG